MATVLNVHSAETIPSTKKLFIRLFTKLKAASPTCSTEFGTNLDGSAPCSFQILFVVHLFF